MARPTLSALFGHPPAACIVAHMARTTPPGGNRAAASRAKTRTEATLQNEWYRRNPQYLKPESTGDKIKAVGIGAASLGAGPLVRAIAKTVGVGASRAIGNVAGNAAFDAASKGLEKARAGGRVFRTTTPFGPSLGSTKIMTANQVSAAVGNLAKRAENIANYTERTVTGTLKGVTNTVSRALGTAASAASLVAAKGSRASAQPTGIRVANAAPVRKPVTVPAKPIAAAPGARSQPVKRVTSPTPSTSPKTVVKSSTPSSKSKNKKKNGGRRSSGGGSSPTAG